jgi:hypothetical protein
LGLDEAWETYNMLPAARDCDETRRVFGVDVLGSRVANAALCRHGCLFFVMCVCWKMPFIVVRKSISIFWIHYKNQQVIKNNRLFFKLFLS